MGINVAALARPVGPLPLWGWGALAGGGILVYLAARGHAGASAVLDPNTATPAPPAALTGAAASLFPPQTIPAGSTVYDPNTGTATSPVSLSDILGGQSITDVIGKLGPDYQNFSLQDGELGVNVQHSAQNVLDAQQAEITAGYAEQLAQASQEAYYAAAGQHDTNYFAALQALIASGQVTPNNTDWSWLFGHGPTPWGSQPPITTPAAPSSPTYSLGNYGTTPTVPATPTYGLGNYGTAPPDLPAGFPLPRWLAGIIPGSNPPLLPGQR